MKKRCGIRYTVKVAKDTDKGRKKNFRELKTYAQITYHLDNRQSNTEEEEEEGHIHVRDETNIFREMYTEKRKCKHTHTHQIS